MDIITLNQANIEHEHVCCAIGNDKESRLRAQTKKEWLRHAFEHGLVFKRLNVRGKVFIEYVPIEYAWKPVIGHNYMLIHCLWVSGQFKGQGFATALLNACKHDALAQKMDGIVVVTSSNVKPFLTDKNFYLKHGFEVVDTALPYFELLALKLNTTAPTPHFTEQAKRAECDNKNGFTFIYCDQCPFMKETVVSLSRTAHEMEYATNIIHLTNPKEAQTLGSPFGTFGIYFNGKLITHEPMSSEKFRKVIASLQEANIGL